MSYQDRIYEQERLKRGEPEGGPTEFGYWMNDGGWEAQLYREACKEIDARDEVIRLLKQDAALLVNQIEGWKAQYRELHERMEDYERDSQRLFFLMDLLYGKPLDHKWYGDAFKETYPSEEEFLKVIDRLMEQSVENT